MEFRDKTTEELVSLYGDEIEKYWDLRNNLLLKESRKESGRKDLEQLRLCLALSSEILSRPQDEAVKLKSLLNDKRPGVRLRAATDLEEIAFNDALAVFIDLAKRNFGKDGYADPYGAQARLALSYMVHAGKIAAEMHPDAEC